MLLLIPTVITAHWIDNH